MPDDLQELQERAEEAAHHASLVPVTIRMAILAVLVAAVSLLGHRATTEELLSQTKATDQWAYYQSKDIRRRSYEVLLDELGVFALQSPAQAEQTKTKYEKQIDKYKDEQAEIEIEAKKLEEDVKTLERRADRFDLAEVLLEAALVVCSITLLTRKRIFWLVGTVAALAALGIAASGFLIH
ncbi:MAG TPA: DUF4337 domain-containing protein [Methylomirabilota bacterium]|nr:DUF4337 domain-containing protein [Methylomirabilota bacterium]